MAKKQPSLSNFHMMLIGCVLGALGLWWFNGTSKDVPQELTPIVRADIPQIVYNDFRADELRFQAMREFDYTDEGYPSLSRSGILPELPPSLNESIFEDPFSAFYEYDDNINSAPSKYVEKKADEVKPELPKKEVVPPLAEQDLPVMNQPGERPKIVIIIDDMGIDRAHSSEVTNLPGPLTLSYLPYAEHIISQTSKAYEKGHALMVHMPMEPVSEIMMNTPGMLHTKLSSIEFQSRLDDNLNSFQGFMGINNHMGSKLTQDEAAMNRVMETLYKRGLYFIDSRTINNSIAADRARAFHVPVLVRDIFLDHEADIGFVRRALGSMEQVARRNGLAIAIGHPKPATIQGLREWLPTLEAKGFELVTAEQVIRQIYPDSAAAHNISIAAAQQAGHRVDRAASD